MRLKHLITSAVVSLCGLTMMAQPDEKDVMKAMELANSHFINKYPDPGVPTFVKKERPSNLWTRAVYFEGLTAFAELQRLMGHPGYDKNYDYMSRWGEAHKWTPRNGAGTRDADDYCCCQTYLDMYWMESKGVMPLKKSASYIPSKQCLDNIIAAENTPWVAGNQVKSKGSDGDWTWIDAIQMGLPVFSKMARIQHLSGSKNADRYTDKGWDMYEESRDEIGGGLYNVKDGLWWRDADFVPPYTEPNGEDCYWSRGNGWVYAALVRAMDAMLVAKSADAPAYMEPLGETKWRNIGVDDHFKDYRKDFLSMTKALVKCQRADKFWNVSLHDGNNYGGVELSGTALFIYGMAWGVRHGYLPKAKYAPIVYGTWDAMVKTCLHDDGFLGYVQGTGKQPSDSQPVTYDKQPDFDDYGLGCFLLCGTEVVRLIRQGK